MKVKKVYNQIRRDCWCDLECESCGNEDTYKHAYDDRNFWDNVVPDYKCKTCGKSSNDMGLEPEKIATRYADHEIV